ncbi:SusE domain-containing protein [Reichenbachiella agariperforans]|uniref:SusE domain-containing protein n=1 Tax=Reichenbachiella agariperforans TaxID=156994 RepID=UPI001C092FF0|nr:SusE domain-containing protein [Reichenbachiella agariperforans]MBU2913737.1 SusE domain-containing protein [Reichenbachiella agariperforans]
MKNFIYITLTLLVGLGLVTGCEQEEAKKVVDLSGENSEAPVIENAATGSADLSMETSGDVFEVFNWTAADYGQAVAVGYVLKMDINSDFSTATNLMTTEELTASVTVKQINDAAILLGAVTGEEIDIYIRVVSQINGVDESAIASSDVVRTVTPYEVIIDYPAIYVPGAYQGWSPGAENGRLYSYDFDAVYEGIIRVIDAANPTGDVSFKVTPQADWSPTAWGGTLTAAGTGYTGDLDASGGDYSVAAGVYAFTVDTEGMTIEMTKVDDWGIIGDATPGGWDNDTDLIYNGQLKVWEITVDLVVGGLKIRANDEWVSDYGDDDADGTLNAGGANISVTEAGSYTLQFDLEGLTYTMTKNEE